MKILAYILAVLGMIFWAVLYAAAFMTALAILFVSGAMVYDNISFHIQKFARLFSKSRTAA